MTVTTTTDTATLVVEGLSKSYGRTTVLDRLSFTLTPGTTTVLGGTNGTGKSTLLRCLAGLAAFTGSVRLGGMAVHRQAGPELRRQLSFLPQSPGFPESGTVGEVLDLFARLRGASTDDVALPPDFLPSADRRLGTLSGGQQQRVAVAIALMGAPRLLLLDEPTASLDPSGRAVVWSALAELTARGCTVLVASPAPTEIDEFAHGRITLDAGHIVGDTPPTAGSGARIPADTERWDTRRPPIDQVVGA